MTRRNRCFTTTSAWASRFPSSRSPSTKPRCSFSAPPPTTATAFTTTKSGPKAEGYDDVLVHGPLQAALLARAIGDWIGGRGRLVSFSVQNRAVAHPGESLTFGGEVTGKRLTGDGAGLVDLDIAGRRDGTMLMPGTATVELPRRGAPS